MIKRQGSRWKHTLVDKLNAITKRPPLRFSEMTPKCLPARGGVYLITARAKDHEIPYYVGRTGNLRRRLYTNHLMGPESNSRLKHYLIAARRCKDAKAGKKFLMRHCNVRWVLEGNSRHRGAIEGYVTAVLFPKYGIADEH